MRLLDVCAVLKRERDIQQAGSKTEVLKQADDETEEYAEVLKQFDDEANKYAIVSHRWGIRTEVNFDGITRLMEMNEKDRDKVRDRDGYRKIIKSCEKAEEDGHRWLWIDTCCIDKRNSVELSEAICSMYRWYSNSQTCYVYLNNVDESVFPTEQDFSKFRTSNGWPEWFSRGWTLQELIAPTELEFFNKSWVSIGTKQDLTSTLEDITRIPVKVLGGGRMSASRPRRNFAQMMSWAADRKTTRVEDRAYSLMGLFGVNMPMMYGEGPKAFQRLQLEILRVASDHTILAWNPKGTWSAGSVLADDPSCFRDCHDIQNMDLDEFVHKVGGYMRRNMPGKVIDWIKLSRLRRRMRSLQLSRWDVTNLGIRVTLPVLPHRDLPKLFFRVMLPCCDGYGNLITIDIFSGNDRSYRWSYSTWLTVGSVPVLKSLYVPYVARTVESRHDLRLHDRRAFWHGFTRCGTLPCEIVGNVVTLPSQGTTLYVFVYANNDGSRFAVGIGYFLDRLWAHIVCDEHPAKQEALSWVDFANRVYDHLRNPSSSGRSHVRKNSTAIWDAHLPQTIWDARVFCCSNGESCFNVMIDIEQCSGCCTGPREEVYVFESQPLWLPWTSNSQGSHELRLDGELAKFDFYSGQEIALGDYSDSSGRNFKRCGNIFEDMQKHGIDSTDSVYHPVVSCVSSCKRVSRSSRRMRTQNEVAVTSPVEDTFEREGAEHAAKPLVLYQPKARSLPDTEDFELLLKALSTRLSGKCLVTTVIECSRFNTVDDEETRVDVGGALDGGIRSVDQGALIPLCIVANPLAWSKELPCGKRWINFINIREHFYALANLHHITGIGARHCFSRKRKTHGGVDFPTLFSLEHLEHYVGKITFFQRLSSMVETQLRSEGSAGNELSAHLSNPLFVSLTAAQNLLKRSHRSDAGENSRNEVKAPLLLKKCEVLQGKLSDETKKTRREVESISRTLSVGLLEHIRTSFLNASEDNQSRQAGQVCSIHYDKLNVRSTVQEIVELQTTLDATQNEDEQRALEEDITGKILWFCWCGVSAEVDQLLPKVLIYVRTKFDSMAPKPTPDYDARRGFRAIAEIMQKTPRTGQEDDMTHLQRIMLDAGAGVSKHKLWLGARAAEQARCGRLLKGDPAVDNQETGLSTSPEAPSTSIVHQELDTGAKRL